jgi:hypothetical protein
MGRRNELKILRRLAVGALALAAFSAHAGSCMAVGALAAGIPDDIVNHGLSLFVYVNAPTIGEAEIKAIMGCQTVGSPTSKSLCKVVATFTNQCAAEALDPKDGTPGYGWAIANTSDDARRLAMAKCRATAGADRQDACQVDDQSLWCDGSAK